MKTLLVVTALVLTAGCAGVQESVTGHMAFQDKCEAMNIEEGTLYVGMTELAVQCSIGAPDERDDYATDNGTKTRWYYQQEDIAVYTKNGRVTGYRN